MDTAAMLGSLSSLSSRTTAAEQQILRSALQMDEEARASMDRLRPTAELEDDAGQEYQRLAMERGRLARVIAQARANGAGFDAPQS